MILYELISIENINLIFTRRAMEMYRIRGKGFFIRKTK